MTKWFNQLYYFCIQIMEQESFSAVFAPCLTDIASENGQTYEQGAAQAWARVGAAYLGFALCGLPSTELRTIQYSTRETYGPIILDCRWYDKLKHTCLNGKESIQTLLPGPDGTLTLCAVNQELFLEMLDFCREG